MRTTLTIQGSVLQCIPAIHFRGIFAGEVNGLCSKESTRPDAIAVELGPQAVSEIAAWMREMGIGLQERVILPCMVGILMENRLIHPGFRDTAGLLRKRYRMPLHTMSPALLKHCLGFSGKRVVGISSTDSIIEAIRCAVELGIPVYGVDQEEFATGKEAEELLEVPVSAFQDLEHYVVENAVKAAGLRDPYIDHRREVVMAARLKRILTMHRRVLFTGGLAHWAELRRLLTDRQIRPADFLSATLPAIDVRRVVLHPFIALRFMDIYPVISTLYEENRTNPASGVRSNAPPIDAGLSLRKILTRSYRDFSHDALTSDTDRMQMHDYARIPDFERLLYHIRLVAGRSDPPISSLLGVSEAMMPSGFTSLLVNRLMDIGRPWATPGAFAGVPLLSEILSGLNPDDQSDPGLQCLLIGPAANNASDKPEDTLLSSPFSLRFHQGKRVGDQIQRYWQWENEPKEWGSAHWAPAWMWPPCEALLYGMATEAASKAAMRSDTTLPAPFEGTLHQGLDTRATMRSIITGQNRIYVRKSFSTKKMVTPNGRNPDPTVFIFSSQEEEMSSSWTVLIGGWGMGNYIRNKARFDQVTGQFGSNFISSIAMDHSVKVPRSWKPHVEGLHLLEGITIFGNPCINARQSAQWVEENNYTCCPVSSHVSATGLARDYKARYGMAIDLNDWRTALIQFALPFAKQRLVIVAPSGFKMSGQLIQEAKSLRKEMTLVPLSIFPSSRIREVRRRISARSTDPDGVLFPRETEMALGQKADKYLNLLPVYMQNQLKLK